MKYPNQITIPANIDLYECVISSYVPSVHKVGISDNSLILNENEFYIKEFDNEKYVFFGYLVKLSDCSYTEKDYPDDTIFNLKLEVPVGTDCYTREYVCARGWGIGGYFKVNKSKTTKLIKKSIPAKWDNFERCEELNNLAALVIDINGYVFVLLKDCKVIVEQKSPLKKVTTIPEWKKLINGSVFEFTETMKGYRYTGIKKIASATKNYPKPLITNVYQKEEVILEKNKKYKMIDSRYQTGRSLFIEDKKGDYFDSNGTTYGVYRETCFQIEDEDKNVILIDTKSVNKKHLKVLSYPETYQFCISDSSGKLYSGYDGNYYPFTPIFGEFSKAKKFKDLSKLKASLMYLTGYTSFSEGMEHDGFGNKILDIDPTWKAVKINKLTYEVVEEYDIYNWYINLQRLRVLTEKFGSPVRTAFKLFEDKKIEDQYIILVNKKINDYDGEYEKLDETEYYDTKTKILRCKSSIGILTDNIKKACKMKLKGEDVHILRLSNLEEYVD